MDTIKINKAHTDLAGERTNNPLSIERLAQIFKHSSIGMAMQDKNGRWLEINPAFCDLLGRSRQQLIGTESHAFTHPDDIERSRHQLKRLRAGELKNFRLDKRYLHSKGHEVWVRLDVSMVRGDEQLPDFVLTQAQNITLRRQIRKNLADSEAQLQAIIRSMGEGVMVFDLDGQLVLSNERAAEIFGLSSANIVESTQLDERWHVSHPDGRRVQVEEYPAIITLESGEPQREVVFCIKKTDGSDVWVEINTEPVRIEANGSMIAVVASISDITDRRRTQKALADSEQQLNLALDGAHLGMWDWHLESQDFQLNQTATDIIGYELASIRLKLSDIQSLFYEDDRKYITDSMNDHLIGETSQFDIDARLLNKAGNYVWVNMRGRVSEHNPNGNPNRVSGVLVDISERKALEDQLVELATKDALTGLYNRGFGSETLDREIAQTRRSDGMLSLILMDVDHFKNINDAFGHAYGDQVLIEIGKQLQQRLRKTDVVSRWGGEEFAIIMPNTPLKNAHETAHKLMTKIRNLKTPDGNNISMSMGITEYRPEESSMSLLKRADQLMYDAKNAGRDQIRMQR